MKEAFEKIKEKCLKDSRIGRMSLEAFLEIVDQVAEESVCEWKWEIDYADVQCKGDRIIFGSRRLFEYCPYCGKKIKEVERSVF